MYYASSSHFLPLARPEPFFVCLQLSSCPLQAPARVNFASPIFARTISSMANKACSAALCEAYPWFPALTERHFICPSLMILPVTPPIVIPLVLGACRKEVRSEVQGIGFIGKHGVIVGGMAI